MVGQICICNGDFHVLLDISKGCEDQLVGFLVESIAAIAEARARVIEARGVEKDAAFSATYVKATNRLISSI